MKKLFYLMAFMVLLVCGQTGVAQAEAVLEPGWYYIQTPDGKSMGFQQSNERTTYRMTNGIGLPIALNDKPHWCFQLEYVDEESGKITLKSISSGLSITETDIGVSGGNQVVAQHLKPGVVEPDTIWQIHNNSDGTYTLYAPSSTEDEKQLLRYYGDNVVTSSEYNVGKNYFWKFTKTDPMKEYKDRAQ